MRSIAWQGDWPVTQPYGETSLTVEPIYKTLGIHFHCGVDIGMPMDTSLFAPAAGTVTDVGWGRLGIRVGALTHWFIHIDRAIVRVGDPVARGRLVALSGNKVPTGGATTGPHLHFEVQRGYLNHPETSVDPMPVLISAQGAGSGELGVFMAALTDAQQLDMYNDIQALRNASVIRDGVTRDMLNAVETDLKAAIAAIATATPAPPPDLAALTAKVDSLAALVLRIEAALKAGGSTSFPNA